MDRTSISGRIRIIVGLAISLACAWLALRDVRWPEVWAVLMRSHPTWLLAGIVLLAGGYLLRILRWWLLLRTFAPQLRPWPVAGPFMAGFALNNLLPLRAGDAVRVLGFRGRLGIGMMPVLGTLVVERVLDATALLVVLLAALSLLPPGAVPDGVLTAAGRAAGIAGLGVLALTCAMRPVAGLCGRLGERPGTIGRLAREGACLAHSLLALRNARTVAALFALSLGAWILEGALFAAVLVGTGSGIAWSAGWLAMAAGTLATLLPGAPGHAGTFDYAVLQTLVLHGMERNAALAAALLTHLLLWLPVTAVGLAWLGMGGLRASVLRGVG